jgi:pimeloyl-ACP methyl ester carboxylesterase
MHDRHWKAAVLLATLAWTGSACAATYTPCTDANTLPALKGSVCARESLPASYASASAPAPELTIFIRKFPAAQPSKGSVWLVPGGPGESGASLYPFIALLRRSFPGFDLIVPDHRGTGYSSRLCPREEAVDSPGGTALAGAEWGSCFGQLIAQPAQAQVFSITNAAHDLRNLILQAQGNSAGPTYLYGVSYGTQLVLRTMQLGPLPVDGLVLDSLVPLETAPQWDLSHRSSVVDDVGRQILARCDAAPDCHGILGDPAQASLRRLLASYSKQQDPPIKDLRQLLGTLLDMPALRDRIPYLIKDLEQGRKVELDAMIKGLEAAQASLGGYPQSPPSIPLVSIISSSENNLRPALSAAELRQEESQLLFKSPLPALLLNPTLPTYARDAYFGALPKTLPPTLVLNGTLDPKTHYQGALQHVAALRERGPVSMVSIVDAPHFILWVAPECFEQHVRAFAARGAAADASCKMASRAQP